MAKSKAKDTAMDEEDDTGAEGEAAAEGSPKEEATESSEEAASEGDTASEKDGEGAEEGYGDSAGVKVPEAIQKAAISLVEECKNEQCLDFIMSEISEKRKKLMSSQKKAGLMRDDFNMEGAPTI